MERYRVWRRRLRRAAHVVAAIAMGLCAVMFLTIGAIEVHDRNLPRFWGTFTETSTRCTGGLRHSCTATGTWISDDRAIVKRGITLDGSVEPGHSVRAVYRPGGGMSDAANDIVHTARWANAGLWLPFLGAVVAAWCARRVWADGRHVEPAPA